MEWYESHTASIRLAINRWSGNPLKDTLQCGAVELKRYQALNITKLSTHFITFADDSLFNRFKAEHRMLNKVFNTSRDQIRSFIYVRALKKLRQVLNKIVSLNLPGYYKNVATEFCSSQRLITSSSLHSLTWRTMAALELCYDVRKYSMFLTEYASEEMTSKLFLHYPMAFVSLAASLSSICLQLRPLLFQEILILIEIDRNKGIPLPQDEDPFPILPNDPSLTTSLEFLGDIVPIAPQSQGPEKLDIQFSSKPMVHLRKTAVATAPKRKSKLEGLGF